MEKLLKVSLFVFGIAVVCISISWIMFSLAMEPEGHSEVGHEWLHDKLQLTEQEIEMIDQVELRYAERFENLEKTFAEKQEALAKLLIEQEAFTDSVKKSVRDVHHAHGDLQSLSIEHYYDMLETLPASKRERLKQLAAKALSQHE